MTEAYNDFIAPCDISDNRSLPAFEGKTSAQLHGELEQFPSDSPFLIVDVYSEFSQMDAISN